MHMVCKHTCRQDIHKHCLIKNLSYHSVLGIGKKRPKKKRKQIFNFLEKENHLDFQTLLKKQAGRESNIYKIYLLSFWPKCNDFLKSFKTSNHEKHIPENKIQMGF